MADEPETLNKTEARAGATPHVTRYVLMISLVLIVVAFAALLLIWR
jgi:hypothetical protein